MSDDNDTSTEAKFLSPQDFIAAQRGPASVGQSEATELPDAVTLASRLRNHAWLERFRKADYRQYLRYSQLSPTACNDIAGYVDQLIDAVLKDTPPDAKDARIAELGQQVAQLTAELAEARKDAAQLVGWYQQIQSKYAAMESRLEAAEAENAQAKAGEGE